jgi:2,4-dienoyl-CoA reductase-like NADH-dependent reductase (Old Yellow Enzyme family)
MKFENLLKPIKIRNMELRNRVVFPAMATNLIADGGYMTDQLIDYHAARALGGNGLNITEAASVHTPSAPRNFLCISEDKFIPGLKKFTDAIHEAGGKACVQLWQGGIVAASNGPEVMCVVPSDFQTEAGVVPGASLDTIKEVVKSFGDAARRAAEAGFDCLEIGRAHV